MRFKRSKRVKLALPHISSTARGSQRKTHDLWSFPPFKGNSWSQNLLFAHWLSTNQIRSIPRRPFFRGWKGGTFCGSCSDLEPSASLIYSVLIVVTFKHFERVTLIPFYFFKSFHPIECLRALQKVAGAICRNTRRPKMLSTVALNTCPYQASINEGACYAALKDMYRVSPGMEISLMKCKPGLGSEKIRGNLIMHNLCNVSLEMAIQKICWH